MLLQLQEKVTEGMWMTPAWLVGWLTGYERLWEAAHRAVRLDLRVEPGGQGRDRRPPGQSMWMLGLEVWTRGEVCELTLEIQGRNFVRVGKHGEKAPRIISLEIKS